MRCFLEEVPVKECICCTTLKKILQSEVIETHIPNFTIAFSKLIKTQLGWIVLTSPPVSSPADAILIVLSLMMMSSIFNYSRLSQIYRVGTPQQQIELIKLFSARCLGVMEFKWLECLGTV